MPKPLPILDVTPVAESCCTPLAEAPLSTEQARDLAARFKALADPARLRLVSILLASPDGESCTCDLTGPLGLSQPTVTHHLRTLTQAGIVTADRRGVWTHYRVSPDALAVLSRMLVPSAELPTGQPSGPPTGQREGR